MADAPLLEFFKLCDGSSFQLARLPEVDEATWRDVKAYLEKNPKLAKCLHKTAKDPQKVRGWLQTQAIAEHYHSRQQVSDEMLETRVNVVENDPELAPVFEDIKRNGMSAALKHYRDEKLMLLVNTKLGGSVLAAACNQSGGGELSLHDACKRGDLKAVREYLATKAPIDTQDHLGVTPLGYAIGANRLVLVKLLINSRANPYSVDSSGNGGVHYAAGYGRTQLLEYFLDVGVSVMMPNCKGQTTMQIAAINKQEAIMDILKRHGVPAPAA